MKFEVEVLPRSPADRTFGAWYQIETATDQAAIAEAMRRFGDEYPDKRVADYTFRVTKG